MGQVDDGTYREQRRVPFSKFCDKWLAERESRVKPTTYRFYKDIVNLHLKSYFKDRPVHQIRAEDIEAYLTFKRKEKKLSARTIGYHLTVLRMIFKKAIIWEYVKKNPAQYIEKPRAKKFEMQILKPEEVQVFLEHVDKDYYPFFLTAVMTGMRLGELLALRWSDINWFSQQIYVGRAVSLGKIEEPKSRHSVRKVAMAPVLAEALKKHKKALKVASLFSDEEDLIFPNAQGGLLDGRNVYHRYFIPSLKKAGLPRVRFHDLRHTYASLLIHQGENVKFIQAQLGHGSISVTLDRYGHLLPDAHNGVGERLQEAIFGTKQEESAKILLS